MKIVDRNPATLTPHPLSDEVFGPLPDDEMADLVEDVCRRGIQDPLKVDGQMRVLCGSQRLRACITLAMKTVPTILLTFDSEQDLEEHLIRDNLHRRHLTPRQKYKACRQLERIESDRAKQRQGRRQPAAGSARSHASKEAGLSTATYERMKAVYERGDSKIQADVDAGRLSISAAAVKVRDKTSMASLRAMRLPGDDPKAHALRMARLKREGKRLIKYLDLHTAAEYGNHQTDAKDLTVQWASKLQSWATGS